MIVRVVSRVFIFGIDDLLIFNDVVKGPITYRILDLDMPEQDLDRANIANRFVDSKILPTICSCKTL